MSAFTPTLRLILEPAEMKELIANHQTLETVSNAVKGFFAAQDFMKPVTFSSEKILVIEDNSYLLNFKALVIAIFEVDGVTCLKLATGDVVEIKFHLIK